MSKQNRAVISCELLIHKTPIAGLSGSKMRPRINRLCQSVCWSVGQPLAPGEKYMKPDFYAKICQFLYLITLYYNLLPFFLFYSCPFHSRKLLLQTGKLNLFLLSRILRKKSKQITLLTFASNRKLTLVMVSFLVTFENDS